jgi:antirestriction protein
LGVALLANYLIEEAERLLSENYYGEYKSQVNFTYALFDECYSAIPQRLRFYFDFEAFARDLFISDFFCVEADGKVHVFSNH